MEVGRKSFSRLVSRVRGDLLAYEVRVKTVPIALSGRGTRGSIIDDNGKKLKREK